MLPVQIMIRLIFNSAPSNKIVQNHVCLALEPLTFLETNLKSQTLPVLQLIRKWRTGRVEDTGHSTAKQKPIQPQVCLSLSLSLPSKLFTSHYVIFSVVVVHMICSCW